MQNDGNVAAHHYTNCEVLDIAAVIHYLYASITRMLSVLGRVSQQDGVASLRCFSLCVSPQSCCAHGWREEMLSDLLGRADVHIRDPVDAKQVHPCGHLSHDLIANHSCTWELLRPPFTYHPHPAFT